MIQKIRTQTLAQCIMHRVESILFWDVGFAARCLWWIVAGKATLLYWRAKRVTNTDAGMACLVILWLFGFCALAELACWLIGVGQISVGVA